MRLRLLVIVAALLAAGCAQVREISGGEKDIMGPRLLDAFPPNGSTRFSGDRFVLRFDERIQIERPRAGLLVSPPMSPPPTMHQRGSRELEVRLHAPLQPATTYSFAIGEAVKDLTEGNRAGGLDYALSTGDALDSLMLHGTLCDAFTLIPQEQALVMLLEAGDTASFTTGRPAFITRTDREGRFNLTRLPERPFHVVALRDLNGNYRYDLPGEEIAFIAGTAMPHVLRDSTASPIALALFKETSPMQQLREAMVTDDRALRLVLAKPAERIELQDIARTGGQLSWLEEWGAARDTVLLWPSDTTALSDGRYALSTEEGALDTLRYRPLRPMPYHLGASGASDPTVGGIAIRLLATRPIRAFDPALMRLRSDTVDLPLEVGIDTLNPRQLNVQAGLLPGQGGTLTLLPRALRCIYSGTNDTLRIAAGVSEASALGTLRVTVLASHVHDAPLILELIDAHGRVARRHPDADNGKNVTWARLQPGNYSLRLMEDRNGNGRWDPGEWRSRRAPEPIWLHADPINVRAAWDLGIEWRISAD